VTAAPRPAAAPASASAADRFLRIFTDVRPGEATTALLLALNVFLLFTAYYALKVLRDSLILTVGGREVSGAQIASYLAAGMAGLLAIVVPAYGALAGRMPRRTLINVVTGIFVACLAVFFLLAARGVPIGIPYYVWMGVFNVMIVAQFWAFANDVYTEAEGKRLFPIVGVGSAIGALLGAWVVGRIIGPLGFYSPFLLGGLLLVAAALVTGIVDRRERRRTEAAVPDAMTSGVLPAATGQFRAVTGEHRAVAESPEYQKVSGTFTRLKPGLTAGEVEREEIRSTGNAFGLVLRNRYLLLIALLVILLNWVNTNGQYILNATLDRIAEQAVAEGRAATEQDVTARFFSGFYTAQNLAGLLIQLFLVSRILKYFGTRVALLVLPVLALGGYTLLAFSSLLPLIKTVKIAENSTDYTLNNTVRNVLFLPTTREEKYKAKQVTDAFSQRAGDVLHSALIFVATGVLALGVRHLAIINLVLVVLWVATAVGIGRRYGKLAAATGA
jgi:AAA family ATP:ADP antiporter